ncbi:MFS transporter [Acidianus infernus]|uniref:MFS transporter n=1 Tax=Acidianus infernus TaxID=12915 RepID=A0A6A9QIG1_ACIIN|nr:MFS transporter [Acidianus infernus]MUM64946.1 MFS transporter [Acidianus infernus]
MLTNRREVLKISFSAFFADLGYQAAVASFPIILVFYFHAPIFVYGIAESLNYGGGSLMSLLGGYLADKYGRKKIGVIGNSLIVILSFTGLAANYIQAIILFMLGWWFRNFRTPARRAMVSEVTQENERSEAYGILHALDIGGAALAILYLTIALYLGIKATVVVLLTAIPLVISTILLAMVKAGGKGKPKLMVRKGWILVISTMFFAFSQYSFGFPIITTAEFTHKLYLATITYGVFLVSSALFGYIFGKLRLSEYKALAFLGYLLASLASLGFAFLSPLGLIGIYPLSFLMGIAVASTETFEPTIISKLSKGEVGTSMGALSLGRSIGLLIGNTAMGFLYQISFSYAYAFASIMSFIAFMIVLTSLRE